MYIQRKHRIIMSCLCCSENTVLRDSLVENAEIESMNGDNFQETIIAIENNYKNYLTGKLNCTERERDIIVNTYKSREKLVSLF